MLSRIKRYLKDESGETQFIEAAIIYPVVFMCIIFLIYMGLYILQSMILNSYAQKIAVLAAREVAYPGYLDLADDSIYRSSAVDADFGEDIVISADQRILNPTGQELRISRAKIKIKCTFDTKEVKTQAYRYWKSDPLSDSAKGKLIGIMTGNNGIVTSQSILGTGQASANIHCENNVISQMVTVSVEQELIDFGVLRYFGIDTPKAKATASATVSDSDELVRNTDFVIYAVDSLAQKLGININELREKVENALEKVGLS